MESLEHEPFGIMGRPTVMAALLIGPSVLGLLCYIWAFCSQSHDLGRFRESLILSLTCNKSQLRGVQHIHGCLVSFLVSDVVTAACAIALGVMMLQNNCDDELCAIVSNAWLAFRYFGLSGHLITALVSVVLLCHPSWGKALRYSSRLLLALAWVFILLGVHISDFLLMVVNVYALLVFVAIVLHSFTSLTAQAAKQRMTITLIAAITFLCICLPNFVMDCFFFKLWSEGRQPDSDHVEISVKILYATNFQIFMNGLLCHFVLKLNVDDERHKDAIEPV